jgi:Domain of unknown function (DUF5655)
MNVESHFAKTDPTVRAVYQRLIEVAQAFGPVTEDPKKTSIHLTHHVTFAGVAARRSSLTLVYLRIHGPTKYAGHYDNRLLEH